MQKRDLFVIIIILVLIGAATFFPKHIQNLLSSVRNALLPETTELPPVEPEEPLNLTLPKISPKPEEGPQGPAGVSEAPVQEPIEGSVGQGTPVPSEPSLGVLPLEPEKPESSLSLDQIRERVAGIAQETELIKQRVAELVEASERKAIAGRVWTPQVDDKARAARLTDIQEQIREISGQINIISAQITELGQAPGAGV